MRIAVGWLGCGLVFCAASVVGAAAPTLGVYLREVPAGALDLKAEALGPRPLPCQAARFRLVLTNVSCRTLGPLPPLPTHARVSALRPPDELDWSADVGDCLHAGQRGGGSFIRTCFSYRPFYLQPNESVSVVFTIAAQWTGQGFRRLPVFANAGTHGVAFDYRNSPSDTWPSQQVEIEVAEPAGQDAEALDALESDSQLRRAMLSATATPADEVAEKLRSLCRRFPRSSYAAYARFALARYDAAQKRDAAAIESLDAIDCEKFGYGAAALWLRRGVLARSDAAAAAACRKQIDRLFPDAYETHVGRKCDISPAEWQAMRDALTTPEVPSGAIVLRPQPEAVPLFARATAVAPMPGGNRWLSIVAPLGEEPRSLRISDLAERKVVRTYAPIRRNVQSLAVSPDGKWAAFDQTADDDPFDKTSWLVVYDLATGEKVNSFETVFNRVTEIAFAADGSRLAVAGSRAGSSTIYMIDPAAWEVVGQLKLPEDNAWRVGFSGDSRELVAGYLSGKTVVWRLDRVEPVISLPSHLTAIAGVAYSPDGALLATASFDGATRLWRRKGFELLRDWRGHRCDVYGVAFSPDGKYLATAGYDRCAKLWDVATGKAVAVAVDHAEAVSSVVFARDGKSLATQTKRGQVNCYDLAPLAAPARPTP